MIIQTSRCVSHLTTTQTAASTRAASTSRPTTTLTMTVSSRSAAHGNKNPRESQASQRAIRVTRADLPPSPVGYQTRNTFVSLLLLLRSVISVRTLNCPVSGRQLDMFR